MIRAFIFDLDGVIVDTSHQHFLSWVKLGEKLGFDVVESDNDHLKGAGRRESLDYLLRKARIQLPEHQKQALTDQKNAWYLDSIEHLEPKDVLAGVKEFLLDAKERGILLAIGSGSKNARMVLGKLELTELFDAISDGTDVTESKPHPEVFLIACEKLDVNPFEAVVFEDAAKGVDAALAAGCKVIGFGDTTYLERADLVVPDMTALTVKSVMNQFSNGSIATT